MATRSVRDLVRELQETPESAVQNLACLIGYVRVRLTEDQFRCAVDCLYVLGMKAGVSESIIDKAME